MQKVLRMSFVKCTCLLFIFLVVLVFLASAAHARLMNRLVIFGDSLSDTGNLFANASFPPSPPYDTGRFSNGPLWVETLAVGLGFTAATPSLFGGTNYAWGGAETGYGMSSRNTPNIGVQISAFLADNIPSKEDLYVIWAGSNDFANAALLPDPADLVQNIRDHITIIASAAPPGAKLKFLVANLPPLGQTARAQWLGQYYPMIPLALDGLSTQFNALLATALAELEADLGIKVFYLDIYSLSEEILNDPSAFGFTNITGTARIGYNDVGGPPDVFSPDVGVVPNPDEYVFFDDVHPTRAWHRIVGYRALSVVSQPIAIDIKPRSDINSINPRSNGKIPVAILSTADFYAPDEVDRGSLMFGPGVGEKSLAFCSPSPEDVNGDGYDDLICHFYTQITGFGCEDTEGILKGRRLDGTPILGRDSVIIVPCH